MSDTDGSLEFTSTSAPPFEACFEPFAATAVANKLHPDMTVPANPRAASNEGLQITTTDHAWVPTGEAAGGPMWA